MFTVSKEFDSIADFEAWSGGATVLEYIVENEEALAYIDSFLEELTSFQTLTATQVNDFLWFDADVLLDEAGINLYDNDDDEDEE